MDRVLTREQILRGFTGSIDPVRPPFLYRAGLAVVCLMMILLPLVYLAIIALAGWGVVWHATHNTGILTATRGRGAIFGALLYVTPIFAGAVLVVFLVKPLFAPRARPPVPLSLNPTAEPLVFDLVRKLCEVVGAPMPRRIDVDTQVNASASFRRGFLSFFGHDLLLTIGMPLVAGFSLRNLVGVLAHEFGHFAQGSGMRATFVIRSINAWFARVVYERDAWDATLEGWCRGTDFRIAIVVYVIRFFIWLTRRILWALMMAGHAVSMFMLRQMEYDADQYEVRVAGTGSFVESARALPLLSLSHQIALRSLQESWNERRLGDHLPRLVLAEQARLPESARREFLEVHLRGKGSLYDTHPPDQRRIERAQRAVSKGVFTLDAPAAALFRDFDALSRRATTAFYREVLGDEFSEKSLVRAETLVAQGDAARSEQEELDRWLGDTVLPSAPLFLPAEAALPVEDPEASLAELRAARADALRLQAESKPALSSLRKAEERLLQLGQLERVARAGLRFKAADFGLGGADEEAVSAARRPVAKSRDGLLVHLAPLRDAFARRLTLALRIAATPPRVPPPDLAPLLDAQAALRDSFPEVRALLDDFLSTQLLLASIQGNEEHEGLVGQLNAAGTRWERRLSEIRPRLAERTYPFDHAKGKVSLAEHLIGRLSVTDDLGATLQAVETLGERYYGLYARVLGRLVAVAAAVEAAASSEAAAPPAP